MPNDFNKGLKLPTNKQREFLKRQKVQCPKTRLEAWILIRDIIAKWDAKAIRLFQDQTFHDALDELGNDDGREQFPGSRTAIIKREEE